MSLQTDIIFVRALRSNAALMSQLPAGDVYNTTIALPDEELVNAPVPYIIVTYDGMQNEDATKDGYEGYTDRVQISIEVAAQTRPQLGEIMSAVRQTVREFFENITDADEDYNLTPHDYSLSAGPVAYDMDKPCYWQVLTYNCDTTPD